MKRITIIAALAFFSAVATGCLGQTSSTPAGTDESTLVSDRAHQVANGEDPTAQTPASPAQALELKTHPNDDGQGPHPEPWLYQEGPHPEPWQGKKIMVEPDPNTGGSGNGSGKP
jgi:hypothetical protein